MPTSNHKGDIQLQGPDSFAEISAAETLAGYSDQDLLKAELSANLRLCADLIHKMHSIYVANRSSIQENFPDIDFDALFIEEHVEDIELQEMTPQEKLQNKNELFNELFNEYIEDKKHQLLIIAQLRLLNEQKRIEKNTQQQKSESTATSVKVTAATNPIINAISPITALFISSLVSPFKYVWYGILSLKEMCQSEDDDGKKHIRIGVATGIAATAFAYAGIAAAVIIHTLGGLAVTAGTLAIAPIFLPIALVPIGVLGFYKETIKSKDISKQDKQEQRELEHLRKTISLNESRLADNQLNNKQKQIYTDRLQMLYARREIVYRKNIVTQHNLRFQNRRKWSSLITATGYVVGAFGLIFPPLALVGLGLIMVSAALDTIDKAKYLKSPVTFIPKEKEPAFAQSSVIILESDVTIAKHLNKKNPGQILKSVLKDKLSEQSVSTKNKSNVLFTQKKSLRDGETKTESDSGDATHLRPK